MTKCQKRARQSVWWPGINRELEDLALSCPECCQKRKQPTTPLITIDFPKLPWETVGMNLFHWKHHTCLLVVDYNSRFTKIALLRSKTSEEVIWQLKIIFAHHGIPNMVTSYNGPQFSSFQSHIALHTGPAVPSTHRQMGKLRTVKQSRFSSRRWRTCS